MVGAIRSRGPDAMGKWTEKDLGLALGHRRLSVLELSEAGAQPMASPSGRYVMVFNGEIYNHLEMRAALSRDQAGFRGESDTETLLAAFDEWGIDQALRRAVGMFALACWNRDDKALFLARDRMGEKPLYWGWQGSGSNRTLLFGSELKAIVRHPSFEGQIDHESVAEYFSRLCVPGTRSIWHGISKLLPGTVLRIGTEGEARARSYWRLHDVIAAGLRERVDDVGEAQTLVHDRLATSVRRQLISDVPLGAFLSGGVDSSLIVALMQEISGGSAKTFSIGFEDEGFNEAHHARLVAQHLSTDHHEFVVTAAHAQAMIPLMSQIYDEPFADSSQIPTFLVSQLARQHVTVALSGDGADELFGGYTRYGSVLRAWDAVRPLPTAVRRIGARAATAAGALLPTRVARGAAAAAAGEIVTFYDLLTDHALTHFRSRSKVGHMDSPDGLTPFEQLLAHDQRTYLPDDILVKVDRAAMAVSLETRAPFLDVDVLAASWRIPPQFKRRSVGDVTVSKWILREILDRYVPRELIERPKQGFGVPIGSWLLGPLRSWAEDLLSPERLVAAGLADRDAVRRLWAEHKDARANHGELLWAVLMLHSWYATQDQWRTPGPQASVRCAG